MNTLRARSTTLLAVGLGTLLLVGMAVQTVAAAARPGLFAPGHDVPNAVIGVLGDGLGEILIGMVLASRLPRNPIGWLLLGFGASTELLTGGTALAQAGYDTGHPSVLAQLSLVAGNLAQIGGLLTIVLVVFLFPTGRIEGRGRQIALRTLWVVMVVFCAGILLSPTLTAGSGHTYRNPLATSATQFLGNIGKGIGSLLFVGSLTIVSADAVRRAFRAHGVERQQMKLFGYATVATIAVIALGSLAPAGSAWSSVDWTVGSNLIAGAIGLAVLRYRLYDIDRVVSRTVSYALVSGILVGVYVGMVALTTRVLPFSSSVGVAASTLAAVALLAPVRRRVQRIVDRRFNRSRYDAESTVSAFAGRVGQQVGFDTVVHDLLAVVDTSLEPRHTGVWLVAEAGSRAG